MDELFRIGFSSSREGADTSLSKANYKQLKEIFGGMAERYAADGMYTKARLIELGSGLVRPIMAMQNFMIRRIDDVDTMMKGISSEATLGIEARRAWHREGGEAMFGNTFDQFRKKYIGFQREVIKIRDLELPPTIEMERLQALFKDQPDQFATDVIEGIDRARQTAKEVTLQQSTNGTVMGNVMTSMKNQFGDTIVGRVALLGILPFRKTPVNAINEVLDHSPLAFTSRRFRDTLREGSPAEKVRVLGKMMTGSSLLLGIYFSVGNGLIQGSIAPEDRERFAALGIKEHSILVDGTWYNYEKIGPVAALISSAADVLNMEMKDPDASGALLLGQSLAIVADDSHLGTLQEILDVVTGGNFLKDGSRFAANRATRTLTPLSGMQSTLTDLLDDSKYRSRVDKEVGGIGQQIRATISQAVANNTMWRYGTDAVGFGSYDTDVNVIGGDIRKYDDTLSGRFLHMLGIGNSKATDQPYVVEMLKHKALPQSTSGRTIEGVPLTRNKYKDMAKRLYHGKLDLDGALNKLVHSKLYGNADTETRGRMLKHAIGIREKFLKNVIFSEDPGLQQKAYERQLFKMMQSQQVVKPDFGSEEYYINARQEAILNDPKNPITIQKFKEAFNIEGEANE
jgi:hypothetical protein